jgi:hypothetical protein
MNSEYPRLVYAAVSMNVFSSNKAAIRFLTSEPSEAARVARSSATVGNWQKTGVVYLSKLNSRFATLVTNLSFHKNKLYVWKITQNSAKFTIYTISSNYTQVKYFYNNNKNKFCE